MNQKMRLFFLTILWCMVGVNVWALSQNDGVYQIATAQDLADFAELVNSGTNTGGPNQSSAILTADIDYSAQNTVIGNGAPFFGTFDGNGHTVKVDLTATSTNFSLFKDLRGVVKNLKITGTITTGFKATGGLVALNYGRVENCLVLTEIVSSVNGDGSLGGIVAYAEPYSQISNSVWAGKITGAQTKNCGGIVGWCAGNHSIINTLAIGDMVIEMDANSYSIARKPANVKIENSYYLAGFQGSVNETAHAITSEDLQSGKVAYLTGLNQELGVDEFPTPLGNKKVYATATDCMNSDLSGFTNTPVAGPSHNYDSEHYCTICGKLDPLFITPVDGYYPLSTSEDVKWFARMVNSGHIAMNAKLTTDIDFSGEDDFQMIGTDTCAYCGIFDGDFHKIKSLKVESTSGVNVGMFKTIAAGAVIKNLIADSECSFFGYQHVGFIGHSDALGYIVLSGIGNEGTVGAVAQKDGGSGDAGIGGIIGNCNGGSVGVIENCWFTGQITTGTSCSFISGWIGKDQFTVKGCWSNAPASESMQEATALCRISASSAAPNFFNCATIFGTQGKKISAESVANGELCYILNGESEENPVWFQKLGTDARPTLTGTDIVFKTGTKNCDGTDAGDFGYSNENTGFVQTPHVMGPDGFCTVCGKPNESEDGYYLVSTPAVLKWVANQVNSGEMTEVNMRLTADLDLSGENWTPIGNDTYKFVGNFDGGRHTISNMVVDVTDTPGGLFGTVGKGTFKDVVFDENCSVTSNLWSGGLIGHSYAGVVDILNVGYRGSVANIGPSGSDASAAAGIIGNANSGSRCNLTSCFVTGPITSGRDIAHFSAWEGNVGAVIKDCWSVAELSETVGMVRGTVSIINCYAATGTQGIVGTINADMLATGELAYVLNGQQTEIKWYQNLGEDPTPLPWAEGHKRVYAVGNLRCDGALIDGSISFQNEDVSNIPDHTFNDGICDVCGSMQPDYLKPVNGFYEVATARQLCWFNDFVNQGNFNAPVKLTADIDLTDIGDMFKSITKYGGMFDGQGHTINGLSVTDNSGNDVGFIRVGLDGLVMQNVVFKNASIYTDLSCAGIVGATPTGQTYTITFNNVGYEGTVQTGGVNAGALIGCNHGSKSIYNINNCYVIGEITSSKEAGVFSGWAGSNGGSLKNSWYKATINGHQEGSDAIRYGGNFVISSCYCITDLENTQCPKVTDEELLNGALTWKLNKESFLSPAWYQTIGEDMQPVWSSGQGLVYKNGEDSYADVHDDFSFEEFRSYTISSETEMADTIIANEALLEDYRTSLSAMEDISDLPAFIEVYRTLVPKQVAIATSAALYAEYAKECQRVRDYLNENSLESTEADILLSYLSEDAEGDETYPNGTFLYIYNAHMLDDAAITAEIAFLNNLLNSAIAADYQAGTEITALMANAKLTDDFNGWEVVGTPFVGGNKEILPAAEGYSQNFSVSQTVRDLKKGVYMLSANATFRPFGDNYSTLYAGMIRLNDSQNYIMAQSEDVVSIEDAQDGVNAHLTGSNTDVHYVLGDVDGYVPYGHEGCSYAFNAGRYTNYTAVHIDVDTLTISLENLGTNMTRDWLGFGNFRLYYLGTTEEATEGLKPVMEGYLARAKTILDFEYSEGPDFAQYPNFYQGLREQLTNEVAKAEVADNATDMLSCISNFSQYFQQIYECRMAYTQLVKTAEALTSTVGALLDQNLITQQEYDLVYDKCETAWEAFSTGSADIAKVEELIAALGSNDFLPPYVDGKYQISTPHDLALFSFVVNTGQLDVNGELMADLDMTDVDLVPIGFNTATNNASDADANAYAYKGQFNGNGHHISNLVINYPDAIGVGLFGTITTGAEISGIVLENTCDITGKDRVGLIGRSTSSGHVTLRKLGNEGNVTSTYIAAAGILGNANAGSYANLYDCYSTGVISSTYGTSGRNSAQICGWFGTVGANVVNCWSTAQISGQDDMSKVFARTGASTAVFTNCYNLIGDGSMAKVMPEESFASGEITYLLNGDQSEIVWYQTLNKDATPVLTASHLVVMKADDGTYYNANPDAVTQIHAEVGDVVSVYDVNGRLVRAHVGTATATKGLSKGLYILRGKSTSVKVLVP